MNRKIELAIAILLFVFMILAMIYVVQTSEIIKNTSCDPCLQIWR